MRVTCKLHVQNRKVTVEVVPSATALLIKALKEPPRDRKKVRTSRTTVTLAGMTSMTWQGPCAAVPTPSACRAPFSKCLAHAVALDAPLMAKMLRTVLLPSMMGSTRHPKSKLMFVIASVDHGLNRFVILK